MIHATVFRVFVAAPSDVDREMKVVLQLVQEWNQTNSRNGVLAEVIYWKLHHRPMGGDEHPQKIIDRRLIAGYDCDVLIGIFGTHLGTPTDTHESGTVEEIEYFSKKKGKSNVMLFFGEWDIKRDTNQKELTRLNKFRKAAQKWAVISKIEKRKDAKDAIRDSLHKVLSELTESAAKRRVPSKPKRRKRGEAKAARSLVAEFAGTWQMVKVPGSDAFTMVLDPSFSAQRIWRTTVTQGRWKIESSESGEARATWDDGWKDKLFLIPDGSAMKVAFDRETDWNGAPHN